MYSSIDIYSSIVSCQYTSHPLPRRYVLHPSNRALCPKALRCVSMCSCSHGRPQALHTGRPAPQKPRLLAPSRREITEAHPKLHLVLSQNAHAHHELESVSKKCDHVVYTVRSKRIALYQVGFKCKVSKRRAGSPPYARASRHVSL